MADEITGVYYNVYVVSPTYRIAYSERGFGSHSRHSNTHMSAVCLCCCVQTQITNMGWTIVSRSPTDRLKDL
jgi:hypothetical protein